MAVAAFDAMVRRRDELIALRDARPSCPELTERPWSRATAHARHLRSLDTVTSRYRQAHRRCEAWIANIEGYSWFVGAPRLDLVLLAIAQLRFRGHHFAYRLVAKNRPSIEGNARTGVLDSPHRGLLWRRWRVEDGLPDDRIAVRWRQVTGAWARGAAPARRSLVFPAYREWGSKSRPVIADYWDGTVEQTLAKLERLLEAWWDAEGLRFRTLLSPDEVARFLDRDTPLGEWLHRLGQQSRADLKRARARQPSRSARSAPA